MNLLKSKSFAIFASFFFITTNYIHGGAECEKPIDSCKECRPLSYDFSARFKPGDSLYIKNGELLNSCDKSDRIFYMRHTLDVNMYIKYGKKDPSAEMKFTVRNKAKWGTPDIVPSTKVETKFIDYLGFEHQHQIPRHLSWIREAWLEFCINDIARLDFNGRKQSFKLGAFPFQLGRGIALGDAYAVGADYVGFYSDSLVDQYAFGAKLSGEIVKDRLTYDIYGALLNNKCGSRRETRAKVFAQEYGKKNCPQRGFGIVNTVIAGRLNITALNNQEQGKLTFEPYALLNSDKEQQVEFRGDAYSRLGTIGLASEYEKERFEFGFDCAVNIGDQFVKGWDRNVVGLQNSNGCACLINSHVYIGVDPCSDEATNIPMDAYKAPQAAITKKTTAGVTEVNTVGKTAQTLITTADRDCKLNGKLIGSVAGFSDTFGNIPEPVGDAEKDSFYNAKDRFRDPYKNKYKGYFFVADGAVYMHNRDIRLAATIGYSSGDADPNFDRKDGDYRGFIPLQEAYAGQRVRSTFYMDNKSLTRQLDTLTSDEKPERFAANVSGFTDLAFVGAGFKWEPNNCKKHLSVNPNVLAFWETWADKKYDFKTNKILAQDARRYLGTEVNIFVEKEILCDLQVFIISSLFIPGSHYDDVKGKPMDKDQQKLIDALDRTAYDLDSIPNIGTDIAFAFNIGFEYKF